jgi:hypothetical protein
MTYQQFEKMTRAELIEKTNLAFERAKMASQAASTWSHGPAGDLLEAQFYMNEIKQRHDNTWIWISFGSELTIIILILIEIAVSLRKG